MRKGIILFGLILILIFVITGCSRNPDEIGLLDMQKVIKQSQRAGELQQELQSIGKELEDNYNQKKDELSAENSNQELDNIYQEYLNNKQRLENQLQKEVKQILNDLIVEKNVEIVVASDEAYYGGIDLTDEVIKRLDEVPKEGEKVNAE